MTSESGEPVALLQVLGLFAQRHPAGSRTADLNRSKTKAIEDTAELGLPNDILERAVTYALDRGLLHTTFSGGSPGSWVTTITQRGYRRRDELEQALRGSTSNAGSMPTPRGRGRATAATILPDRAIRALREQLNALDNLRGRRFDEAEHDETEWRQVTQGILEATYDPEHTNVMHFHRARNAGEYNVMGVSRPQAQSNFDLRIEAFATVIRSTIKQLELQLPEESIKGVYDVGDEYGFYTDLSRLIASAAADVLIVDAYLSRKVFDLYVGDITTAASVRLLTNLKIAPDVVTVAGMLKRKRQIELRCDARIHDRYVFIDGRGWSIGASIKDAARNSPTAMVEQAEPGLGALKGVYEGIWSSATPIPI